MIFIGKNEEEKIVKNKMRIKKVLLNKLKEARQNGK